MPISTTTRQRTLLSLRFVTDEFACFMYVAIGIALYASFVEAEISETLGRPYFGWLALYAPWIIGVTTVLVLGRRVWMVWQDQ